MNAFTSNTPLLLAVIALVVMAAYIFSLRAQLAKARAARDESIKALLHCNHALRTPLTTISGVTEIFEMSQQGMDEAQRKLIGNLRAATTAMKNITNELAGNPVLDDQKK